MATVKDLEEIAQLVMSKEKKTEFMEMVKSVYSDTTLTENERQERIKVIMPNYINIPQLVKSPLKLFRLRGKLKKFKHLMGD